jgi:pimeloyl-ACP methyl ester carboxylesterase
MARSKSVVFVNGAWMTSDCWADFRKPFERGGYKAHTPSWPLLGGASAAELRKTPPAGLGSLTIGEIVDHYGAFIETLDEAPLIIGHSFGGLFTQMLLAQGLGSAGIAIDPAPGAGVVPGIASLAAAFPILNRINGWSRPFTIPFEAFKASFANTAPAAQQKAAYEALVVPTSGRIFYQAASGIGAAVHPRRRTQPLLITVGEHDRTVTPFTAHQTYAIQKHSPAPTDFKLFPGLSHFLIAEEPGWEDVSAFCLDWAKAHAAA